MSHRYTWSQCCWRMYARICIRKTPCRNPSNEGHSMWKSKKTTNWTDLLVFLFKHANHEFQFLQLRAAAILTILLMFCALAFILGYAIFALLVVLPLLFRILFASESVIFAFKGKLLLVHLFQGGTEPMYLTIQVAAVLDSFLFPLHYLTIFFIITVPRFKYNYSRWCGVFDLALSCF